MAQHLKAGAKVIVFLGIAVAVGIAGWGIRSRLGTEAALAKTTDEEAELTVSVATAEAGPAEEDIVLPGTVEAEFETPIYARTNGYLKQWYVDIGAHVKAGTLLAVIDSPEVDQQLRQAQADLLTARANSRIAQLTQKRIHALLPQQFASAERDDQATSDADAKAATVISNQANVERLTQLVGFERVVAPYDGVVTARETDVGNLINAGSGSGLELFRIADTSKLRIYVDVPQTYAPAVRPGIYVELHFPEYPDRAFPAKFVRSAEALNPQTRTLQVELETDNAKGELFPGGYTDVRFKLPIPNRGARISANALLFRAEGLRVASVAKNGHVTLHPVKLGRDFGTTVEILTGIAPGDTII
ncbi:MAG: efflux RND transporter periplasmic adaptor subunit, partial [Dongiaceae bacterium]